MSLFSSTCFAIQSEVDFKSLQSAPECTKKYLSAPSTVPTHFAVQSDVDFSVYEVHLNAPLSPFPCVCQTLTQTATRNSLSRKRGRSFCYVARFARQMENEKTSMWRVLISDPACTQCTFNTLLCYLFFILLVTCLLLIFQYLYYCTCIFIIFHRYHL